MRFSKNLRSVSLAYLKSNLHPQSFVGIPALTLVSLLGVNTNPNLSDAPIPTAIDQAEPTAVANIFNDIFREAEEVLDTLDRGENLLDRLTGGSRRSAPQPSQEVNPPNSRTAPVSSPSQSTQNTTSQVLYRDENPTRCQVVGDDANPSNCNAFQLSQVGDVLVFTYYFESAPISFIASAEPFQQTELVTTYVTGQMRLANDPIEDLGSCVVGRLGSNQYQTIVCNAEIGLEFRYDKF